MNQRGHFVRGFSDVRRSKEVPPPTPPPRDPNGINNIVKVQVGAVEGGGQLQHLERAKCGETYGRRRRSGGGSSIRSSSGGDIGCDSDSSESSLLSDGSKPYRLQTMDELRNTQRSSPLRAVVTPTTVDRTRCSTYDNVDDLTSRRPATGKPPVVGSRSARTPNQSNDFCDTSHLVPSHYLSRPSPVPFSGSPAHYRHTEPCPNNPSSRTSPSTFGRSSAPSPSRYAVCSGRSTPTARHKSADSRVVCSPWKELDREHQEDDSTDSDNVRMRSSYSCKMAHPQRTGLSTPSDYWHHGSCSPCHQAAGRYHWHGTVPPIQSGCGCHSGYIPHSGDGHNFNHEDLQQRVFHQESEKDHLILQASVLSEQVEAQNEKIKELEAGLYQAKQQLSQSEENLKKEIEVRTLLENSKLDMMAQLSSLRIKMAAAEQKRQEHEEKSIKLESELVITSACLAEREADISSLKVRLPQHGGKPYDQNSEIEKLKNALSSVIAANDEKEQKIQDLNTSLNRYKKLQELVLSNHVRRGSDTSSSSIRVPLDDSSCLDTIIETNGKDDSFQGSSRLMEKPPLGPRGLAHPLATSSPMQEGLPPREVESLRCSPILNTANNNSFSTSNFSTSLSERARSSDNVYAPMHKTPPAKRHYGTVPRPHGADVLLQIQEQLEQHKVEPFSGTSSLERNFGRSVKRVSQSSQSLHHPGLENIRQSRSKTSGLSFGKGFFRLRSSKRSSSAPQLVPGLEERRVSPTDGGQSPNSDVRRSSSPSTTLIVKEKRKGIRRIFGKLKRTGSENLDSNTAEFRRGGIRATAGPRLGWPQDNNQFNNMNLPFSQWNSTLLSDWLHTLGLGMYSNDCKKHVRSGEQLLKSSSGDFEKDLGMKSPLHRKKLLLAVVGVKSNEVEPFRKIDYHWIVRWLDDIGLPQYKDSFFDARLDGSVLHYLVVEDLFNLKVTNQLHYISIKRGIQVLRENGFNPQCLKRRCLPGDADNASEVSKWSNHRVMEWLRTVDLSEYAPNLRGSGVHGGLMVYEPRFNAELLASLLNIPPNKTLLRRHLSTQFKQLVGRELMQKKREWEAQPNYTPLSPSAKIKVVRKGQLSLIRKRNKVEVDFDDYVCPMDNYSRSSSPADQTEKPKLSAKSDCMIEDAINDMFVWNEILKDDKAFDNMTATNV